MSRHMDFFVLYQFRFYFCGILNSVLSEGGNRSRVMLTSVWRVMAWSNRKCSKFLGWKLLLQFFFCLQLAKAMSKSEACEKKRLRKQQNRRCGLVDWLPCWPVDQQVECSGFSISTEKLYDPVRFLHGIFLSAMRFHPITLADAGNVQL